MKKCERCQRVGYHLRWCHNWRPKKTTESSNRTWERVHFRYIVMPCCKQQVCWVNPRLPNYCPECGKSIFTEVKSCVLVSDENAALSYGPKGEST